MQNEIEILKVRTLLCFLKREAEDCTVTKIAKTLGEEKYTISRILSVLEKDGLVDKENARRPKLTEKGKRFADNYAERIQTSTNHLVYEGVDINHAQADAFHWALYNSEKTMEIIRNTNERWRVKYEIHEKQQFTGSAFCKRMKDGIYTFPFYLYCENQMAYVNEGFEHTCVLVVKNGVGTIRVKTKPITPQSTEKQVKSLKYMEYGEEINAEYDGSIVSFPAAILQFMTMQGGKVLHGSAKLKVVYQEECNALFTILI